MERGSGSCDDMNAIASCQLHPRLCTAFMYLWYRYLRPIIYVISLIPFGATIDWIPSDALIGTL